MNILHTRSATFFMEDFYKDDAEKQPTQTANKEEFDHDLPVSTKFEEIEWLNTYYRELNYEEIKFEMEQIIFNQLLSKNHFKYLFDCFLLIPHPFIEIILEIIQNAPSESQESLIRNIELLLEMDKKYSFLIESDYLAIPNYFYDLRFSILPNFLELVVPLHSYNFVKTLSVHLQHILNEHNFTYVIDMVLIAVSSHMKYYCDHISILVELLRILNFNNYVTIGYKYMSYDSKISAFYILVNAPFLLDEETEEGIYILLHSIGDMGQYYHKESKIWNYIKFFYHYVGKFHTDLLTDELKTRYSTMFSNLEKYDEEEEELDELIAIHPDEIHSCVQHLPEITKGLDILQTNIDNIINNDLDSLWYPVLN